MNDKLDPEHGQPAFRGPLQGLADVNEALTSRPIHVSTFLRGLTIGALVGAALAGSAIWRRWRRTERDDDGSDGAR